MSRESFEPVGEPLAGSRDMARFFGMVKTIPYTERSTPPMKTKEELNALKEEVENVNKKLAELTDEELAQVSGGVAHSVIHLAPIHLGPAIPPEFPVE